MYCENCGREIPDDATECPFCGANLVDGEEVTVAYADEHVAIGWCILAFLIPIAGIIEYFVFKSKRPKQAKYCGIVALVSIGINILSNLI